MSVPFELRKLLKGQVPTRLLLRGLITTLMLAAVSVQAADQRHHAGTVLLQRRVV